MQTKLNWKDKFEIDNKQINNVLFIEIFSRYQDKIYVKI